MLGRCSELLGTGNFSPVLRLAKTLFLLFTLLALSASYAAEDKEQEVPQDSKILLKVVDAFFSALRKGNLSQAYYGYVSEGFRKATSYKDFKTFVERFPPLGHNQDVDAAEPEFFGPLGTVHTFVKSTDGKENLVVLDVIWESGKWRILGIQIYHKPRLPD